MHVCMHVCLCVLAVQIMKLFLGKTFETLYSALIMNKRSQYIIISDVVIRETVDKPDARSFAMELRELCLHSRVEMEGGEDQREM